MHRWYHWQILGLDLVWIIFLKKAIAPTFFCTQLVGWRHNDIVGFDPGLQLFFLKWLPNNLNISSLRYKENLPVVKLGDRWAQLWHQWVCQWRSWRSLRCYHLVLLLCEQMVMALVLVMHVIAQHLERGGCYVFEQFRGYLIVDRRINGSSFSFQRHSRMLAGLVLS